MPRHTRSLTIAALLAALLAATSWINAVGEIPFTLQTFFVVLAACLLDFKWASASILLYVFLGGIGLPVFAQGAGGLAVLAGPTGGYLVGFVCAAALSSLLFNARCDSKALRVVLDGAGIVVAVAVIDCLGMLVLARVAGLSPSAAFFAGVAPFLLPDFLKALFAVITARYLSRVVWADTR